MATAKEKLAEILAQQPDDSSYNELVREMNNASDKHIKIARK